MQIRKTSFAVAALALLSAMPPEALAQSLPAPTSGTLDVWFKAPFQGNTISGVLQLANCYVKGIGVSRVSFYLDNTLLNTDSNVGDGMSCVLDTTKFTNGTHQLKATAFSSSGASRSDVISVNIQNAVTTPPPVTEPTTPPPTTTPPATALPAPTSGTLNAWFKAPLGGQTVSGTLSLDKCYVKGTGVSRVSFFLDGTALNSDTNVADGMSCTLDTTKFANGTHQLRATAYGSSGAAYNEVISINIQNTSNTNPPPSTTPPPPTTPPPTSSLPSTGVRAVPTFESIGLYWTPGSNPGAQGCQVQYKAADEGTWKQGLGLWYDSRNSECRGSLVHLKPGTAYEVQLGLPGQQFSRGIVTSTWREDFPIARTVHVQPGQSLSITEGGSASGYVLYTPAPGTSGVLDAANGTDHTVRISAPYVIVRGFTLRGARADAVRLLPGARDVVIDRNDISGWGRSRGGSLGVDGDSAVRAICSSSFQLERTVIQNNTIHDPRYGSNSWSSGHPQGPQAITYQNCGANHVFRFNRITSSAGKYYNDVIGGGTNFSSVGFPFADTDIYGNFISNAYDDAIESEGGNRNVRIWGNYMEDTLVAVASTVTHTGPLYVFRNVYGQGGTFGKSGQTGGYGGGRRFFLHNTMLQPSGGARDGIKGNSNEPMTNTMSRNNVWHLSSSGGQAIGTIGGTLIDADYDLSNGNMTPYSGAERNGIVGTPTYVSGQGAASGGGGMYQLAPSSRGFDAGQRLPGFNDGFTGNAPDLGAHEAGAPQMRFGPR